MFRGWKALDRGVVSGVASERWRRPLLGPADLVEAEYEVGEGKLLSVQGLATRMSRNGPGIGNCERVWGRAAGSTLRRPHTRKVCLGEEAACHSVHLSDHL